MAVRVDKPRQDSDVWKLNTAIDIDRMGQSWSDEFDSASRCQKPMIAKRFRDHGDQPSRLDGNSIHSELARVTL
jgi:hypothetical protein